MARDSPIEWTGHTFNPWWGCTKVSPACDHCYAEVWARRTGHHVWGAGVHRRQLSDNYWDQPLRRDRAAEATGRRARVFCASMADVFEWRPDLDALRDRLWCLVERTPNLDWLLLTKRPELARRLTPWRAAWPSNVWLGTTVENQHFADQRIDEYIHLFLVVTKHGVYLDLFAGPQRASDTTNWSVRRVLDRRSVGNPAIHHYAVCDSDSRKAQRLRDLGQRHPSFCVYEGDVNRLVNVMLEDAPIRSRTCSASETQATRARLPAGPCRLRRSRAPRP